MLNQKNINISKLKLTDLIELESLQKIQDAFASSFDMPSIIYDTDGVAITKPSCFTEFCSYVRSTEKGNTNCIAFDAKLIRELAHSKKPVIRKGCALDNIITATALIKIEKYRVVFDDYLTKPARPENIVNLIEKHT